MTQASANVRESSPPAVTYLRAVVLLSIGAALLAALVAGVFLGLGPALLVGAGAALLGVIALGWKSLAALPEDQLMTLEEALTFAAPSSQEEQKRFVLQALRDLDQKRALGKVTEEDFLNLSVHYRTEAKRLLQSMDIEMSDSRKRAEQALQERLAAKGTER